eukprot:c16477_g1_i1 orf=212-1390(+)
MMAASPDCTAKSALSTSNPFQSSAFLQAVSSKQCRFPSKKPLVAFCSCSTNTPLKQEDGMEVVKYLEKWAEKEILPMLQSVEKSWQPQDFLPDAGSEAFIDEVRELRARAAGLPDEYLVCLVGDTITEEALPTYQTMLNSFVGTSSKPEEETAWATWVRCWTAEENRHGDLLNKYLFLTGKVDMRMVEKTIHYLITSGMDVGLQQNPYYGFIYTSFQERATAISHGNTARMAGAAGDMKLARICGSIAADEKRHERAYTKVVEKLLEVDPEGCMVALEVMMRRKIVMPAHLMYDGQDERLFHHFSRVAQRVGVYTAADYADILHHFVQRWKLGTVSLSSGHALAAQDYICSLPCRLRKLEERSRSRSAAKDGAAAPPVTSTFSWIFNREVSL